MRSNISFRVLLGIATLSTSVMRAQSAAVISVGPNVQISKQFPKLPHYESLAAGDPDHSGRLLACSCVDHQDQSLQWVHCYASFDNGKNWSPVLQLGDGQRFSDPIMAYGRGDTVYYTTDVTPRPREGTLGLGATGLPTISSVYRSADGGKSWTHTSSHPFLDRQGIAVDRTAGKYAGRVYVQGVGGVAGFEGSGARSIHLYTSKDGGATFSGPIQRAAVEGGSLFGSSNSVVLSNGTLAFLTPHLKRGRSARVSETDRLDHNANTELQLLTSTSGGDSLNAPVTVSEMYLDRPSSEGGVYSMLAVDPGSRFFKDRLYAVWPDAGSGRLEVHFAHSSDGGRTWSEAITVNDDRPPLDGTRGPDHLLPAVAVNKDGVVLVAWYDQRNIADNMGWRIRAAASLDGGETFTPSTVVSEVANAFTNQVDWIMGRAAISGGGSRRGGAGGRGPTGRPISVNLTLNNFFLSGGHTSGMAVDADGGFHPAWHDNRTGVSQFWTSTVIVRGNVEEHGASQLANLDDITDRVTVQELSNTYDRATNTVTLTARLKNTSRDTIRGPIKARIVTLASQLGAPTVVETENGVHGTGAIWDFGAIPAYGLLPDSTTGPRALTFRLSDVYPIRPAREAPGFTSGVVRFDVRIYGKANGEAKTR